MASIVEKILPDVTGEGRHGQVTLDTWFDRLMKALTVWLPLLVSGTLFLGEITGESQKVFCHPPSNFTIPQANYLNAFCKESVVSGQITSSMFPYFVLSFALLMYIPHLLWKVSLGPELGSQINFITKELEETYGNLGNITSFMTWTRLDSLANSELAKIMSTLTSSSIFRKGLMKAFGKSRKLGKFQIAKYFSLFIFAIASLIFLIWFDVMLQRENIFICRAKINANNFNESMFYEYIEPVCKVIGLWHSYYVSILLSISFSFAAVLPISFVVYIKVTGNNFLDNVFEELNRQSEEITEVTRDNPEAKATAFSDYSIIGRLCGENRHLMPSLNRIMNIEALQDIMQSGKEHLRRRRREIQDLCKQEAAHLDEEWDNGKQSLFGDDGNDSETGATTENMRDVEAVIHPQLLSRSSSQSISNFHTEDETRVKGLIGRSVYV